MPVLIDILNFKMSDKSHGSIQKLKKLLAHRRNAALLVALVVALAGLLALRLSSAATNVVAIEAETGIRSGNIGAGETAGASAGASVKFGTGGNPNPAYFAHLDKLIGMARDRGMQLAIWPAWSQFAVREDSFNASNMTAYGKFLGERYKNTPNVMWTMGGDWGNGAEGDCPATNEVRALANAIKSVDPSHMISYHSGYNQSSSDCHHNESWLDYNGSYWDFDFNNMASAYRLVYRDYNKTPTKPAVMLETAYEGPSPNDDIKLYSIHARKQSVYQVLAGGMGFTYGANSTIPYE